MKLTEYQKQAEVVERSQPRWKRWLFYRIKRLLNITDNYPFCFYRKGKYYDIIDATLVRKKK